MSSLSSEVNNLTINTALVAKKRKTIEYSVETSNSNNSSYIIPNESSITPLTDSPVTPNPPSNAFPSFKYNVFDTLSEHGYKVKKSLSQSLQGSIYIGRHIKGKSRLIIKTASKDLYSKGVTIYANKLVPIQEDVVKEAKLMYHLGSKNPRQGFINLVEFIQDDVNYIMIQKYGGKPFFEYVKYNTDNTPIKEWTKHVRKLFKQMVLFVDWIHSNNVCHLDISLENCVINTKTNVVSFIDFGLSELFHKNKFGCDKFNVGKGPYQSPEVLNENGEYRYYDARKADIWALGMCLWMMLTGCPIYKKPSKTDAYYENLSHGYLLDMIKQWNLTENIGKYSFDLLSRIFCPEKQRITMKEILNHKYVKNVKTYN